MRPNLIIIAGPNGSGKTSSTNKLLAHQWSEDCEYINPDNLAKEKFGGYDDVAMVKAFNYANDLRESILRINKSLIFETVFSHYSKIEYIKRAI